jgi:hypothetical protein
MAAEDVNVVTSSVAHRRSHLEDADTHMILVKHSSKFSSLSRRLPTHNNNTRFLLVLVQALEQGVMVPRLRVSGECVPP